METHTDKGSVVFGSIVHFGPSIILYAVGVWSAFSPLPLIATFFIVSTMAMLTIVAAEKRSPRIEVAPSTFKQSLIGTSHVFLTAIGAGTLVVTAGWWMLRQFVVQPLHLPAVPGWSSVPAAVVISDFIYYFLHTRLNHAKKTSGIKGWFRRNHQIHHSVPVLDFMRGSVSSFADTAVTGFQFPLWVASALLGMELVPTLVAYALLLLLEGTHHANHSFNIGGLRSIFIDNDAHKVHHDPEGWAVNHGVIFSLWDRIFGTYATRD